MIQNKKMDTGWKAISAVAGLLETIGVIVTIINLSHQNKQNNNQLSSAALVAVYEQQSGLVEMFIQDTELSKIGVRGNEDFDRQTD